MLTIKEIQRVFEALLSMGLGFRFGYAGSYAKGIAKKNSDLDVVVEGTRTLTGDEYFTIYNKLKQLLQIRFDIVDLTALKEEDKEMDQMLLDMGLSINEDSAYKTMMREAVWLN